MAATPYLKEVVTHRRNIIGVLNTFRMCHKFFLSLCDFAGASQSIPPLRKSLHQLAGRVGDKNATNGVDSSAPASENCSTVLIFL